MELTFLIRRSYAEPRSQKEVWYNRMKHRGLRVKLALDDKDNVGGMIQYIPTTGSES